MKLLNNKPISILNDSTDYLGILEKANFLKDFFTSIKDNKELKMFCLYGDWGSGKSTVLKYLQEELKNEYNTFFFEAWEYDQNNNIPYSLFEFLTKNSQDSLEKNLGNTLKTAKDFLKGFGKSLKLELEIPTLVKLGFDTKELIEHIEKQSNKTEFELKQDFKKEFKRVERSLIAKGKKPKNIIFIDDLDRCDPEHTLALLSAIKLFFTYGEQTIFICGIDKNAVQEAIKTKYHDYIKSSEYLEKIFDVSFNMPETHNIQKLINVYFDEIPVIYNERELKLNEMICTFFEHLNFTNPRKTKKILNKFHILSNYKKNINVNSLLYVDKISKFCIAETILTLYGICCSEFYPEHFDSFLNFKKRRTIFSKKNKDEEGLLERYLGPNLLEMSLNEINILGTNSNEGVIALNRLKVIFCPLNIKEFKSGNFKHQNEFIIVENENDFEYLFYVFIFHYIGIDNFLNTENKTKLFEIKQLVSNMS